MKKRVSVLMIAVGLLFIIGVESKKLDPYKVLGVDKSASQREIQKAFHKLSLQYHPDKNKKKGAQEKFSEINNAYDILSDEQKRKNYDLYGDETGNPGFQGSDPGDQSGSSYFTGGGPGQSGWQNMGGQGSSKSFSFSFGDPGSGKQSSSGFGFGFGLDDIFSNFFGGGMGGGSKFGFGSSSGSQHGTSKGPAQSVNARFYRKEITDKGMAWLLFFYTPNLQGVQHYESLIDEAVTPLHGALKVGSINCQSDTSLCKELGVHPLRSPKIFAYSYASSESGSLVEFDGNLDIKSLKSFCQDNLPRFSKRINLDNFNVGSETGKLPKVLLLSTKKSTPVIWRVLSGLYHKKFLFYDAQVRDISDPSVRKLGVDSFPAIIGWFLNGEKEILKSGISVKDLASTIKDLSRLLDGFEKKNKKTASNKKDHTESGDKNIPLLTSSNFHDVCGEKVPVCFIGAFRSSKARDKLQTILQSVSQKSFSRRNNMASGSRNSVSYALLDPTKTKTFLNAFDKNGFKSSENVLVAYKPKRGTYAKLQDEITEESVEKFIVSVLNGDVQFAKTRQKPTLK